MCKQLDTNILFIRKEVLAEPFRSWIYLKEEEKNDL